MLIEGDSDRVREMRGSSRTTQPVVEDRHTLCFWRVSAARCYRGAYNHTWSARSTPLWLHIKGEGPTWFMAQDVK